MSFNRENIVWKSPDGTWNRGFYPVSWVDPSLDADPEWDVEYDTDQFEWLSSGHPTSNAALRSWGGANPGGFNHTDDPEDVAYLEKIKAAFLKSK